MLAKITSKNQLTLPRSVTDQIGPAEYFDVQLLDGQIVLTPVRIQRGDAVRAKLAALGLTVEDVQGAVEWARQSSGQPVPIAAEPEPAYRARASKRQPKA